MTYIYLKGSVLFSFCILLAGVVDADYRGNVGVLLMNCSNVDYQVRRGDRIAQLICERILLPEIVECEVCLLV